jgi:hypothetical protein
MNNFINNISSVQKALKEHRDSLGKETKSHHYVNEVRLIRYAISGDNRTTFEFENLSRADYRVLRRVICLNRRLIRSHVDYKLRKQACRELVIKHLEKTSIDT